jgi:hypothetical protein
VWRYLFLGATAPAGGPECQQGGPQAVDRQGSESRSGKVQRPRREPQSGRQRARARWEPDRRQFGARGLYGPPSAFARSIHFESGDLHLKA